MLTDFYCQELLLSCTTGTAKWILSHRPSLESVQTLICNSESILCSSSPQPVSHLQCSQLCYLPFSNILPSAPRFGFYSCILFFDTHLHSLGNPLSFHGLTLYCSFHSQCIFSHQIYQFLNTISIHPTLSAYGCTATNSSLTISLSKLFHCLLHSSLQTNTRLVAHTTTMVTQHLISLTLGLQ